MPQITVGVPVCNSMPYLRDAMDSLLAQTSSDFNILAIVDQCGDGSVEYMKTLRDKRLKVVVEEKRSGLIPTLNRMLREVDTPWLMRQDADDIAYPQRIERTLEFIKRQPQVGIFTSIAEYYPPDRTLGRFRASRGTPEELRGIIESGYLLSFCHPSATLNVEKTLEVGAYSEKLEHAEDADLWWRMALAYDIQIIPEVLLGYRQHPRQSTTDKMTENVVDLLYVQYLLLSRLWKLAPKSKEVLRPHLERLVPPRDLAARDKLRFVNILAAKGNYLGALLSGLKAFGASPKFVLNRVLDELWPEREVVNGIDPQIFAKNRAAFWDL